MIIDFHTHIFPDKIAGKALAKLSSVIRIVPSMDGTSSGLRRSMEKSGVDTSVILPVVTDPHQMDSVIRFAASINEEYSHADELRLFSFGGIHPECSDYKEQLRIMAGEGLKGIKLHPHYQGTPFDDIRYLRIIYTASELGLSVITHAGYDPYTPEQDFCSVEMILHVLEETAPPKLILAHMGNNENYEKSETMLCGRDVYFDTGYSLMHMEEDQLVRMIHRHGADRILFGSDAPWTFQGDCVEKLSSLSGLSQKEKQQILGENAARLLHL